MIGRTALARPVEGLTPAAAAEVCAGLGALARWWLDDAVLHLAARAPGLPPDEAGWWAKVPPLPAGPGACWAVFAAASPGPSLLRPAFLLPLRWAADAGHSPRLPCGLRDLAERAVATLQPGRRFGLRLDDELERDGVDLSAAGLDCGSAWAAVVGGLVLLGEGGEPDRGVWATGAPTADGGVGPVGGLAEKLALARARGARLVFVPEAQVEEACALAGGLGVAPLRAGADVRRGLAPYLAELDAPPPRDESDAGRARRADYYLRQASRAPARADAYYRSDLLPSIAARCREQAAALPWPAPPPLLVTIASDSPELTLIAVTALCPRRVLVLHTDDDRGRGLRDAALGLLVRAAGVVEAAAFADRDEPGAGLAGAVRSFAAGAAPAELAFDLTPGHKLMSLALALAVAPPGSWLLYLRHERAGRFVCPFSERLLAWPARAR
jgi:hypothetical protein